MTLRTLHKRTRAGFTLVELAVVIVIIGVLAAFGVPKFLNSVERSKAAEAFAYLSAIREAEERIPGRLGRLRQRPHAVGHPAPAPCVLLGAEHHHRDGRRFDNRTRLVADADAHCGHVVQGGLHRDLHPGRLRPDEQHDHRESGNQPDGFLDEFRYLSPS